MTPGTDLVLFAVRLALNLTLVGAPVAVSTALALRLGRAVAPRVRYALALAAFCIAAFAPLAAAVSKVEADAGSLDARVATAVESVARSGLVDVGLAAWAVGGGVLLLLEVGGHIRLVRARRRWRAAPRDLVARLDWPDGVALYVDERDGPSTSGLARRAVVLPAPLVAELSVGALRAVARHELDHAVWRDPLVNAVLRAMRALLWVSVPLWLLYRFVRVEREAAADRAAVVATSQREVDYAAALVSVARWSSGVKPRAMAGTQIAGDLEARVARLLAPPVRASWRRVAPTIVVVALGLGAAALAPTARRAIANGTVVDRAVERIVIHR